MQLTKAKLFIAGLCAAWALCCRVEGAEQKSVHEMWNRRCAVILTGKTPLVKVSANREDIISRHFESSEFPVVWGRWLAKLTGCDERSLSPAAFSMKIPGPRLFRMWQARMERGVRLDEPMDEVIHELLASDSRAQGESYDAYKRRYDQLVNATQAGFTDGTAYYDGAFDLFWKTSRSPIENAEFIARNLLGYRIECARCHDHPYAEWTQEDHAGLAAVFQRTVYSELPVTRRTKQFAVVSTGLCSLVFAVGCLFAYRSSSQDSRFRLVLTYVLISFLSCSAYILANYLHLLTPTVGGFPGGLGSFLANQLGEWAFQTAATGIALGALAVTYSMLRQSSLGCIAFALGIGLVFASVDVGFVQVWPHQGHPESLVSKLKSEVMDRVGLGGRGEQVREIYDDTNGNFSVIGTPKCLGGPTLEDNAFSKPRQEFADWLVSPGNPQFARNFVNRVAQRIFNHAFYEPVDDFRDDFMVRDPELLEDWTQGFVTNKYSLRWLLRTMLQSDHFDSTAANSVELCFKARPLTPEEIVASLNQHSRSPLAVSESWSPTPSDPYKCAAWAPRESKLAAQLIGATVRVPDRQQFSTDIASTLMLDEQFREYLRTLQFQGINHATLSLWGRFPTAAELKILESTKDAEDQLWLIVNHSDFLVLQ